MSKISTFTIVPHSNVIKMHNFIISNKNQHFPTTNIHSIHQKQLPSFNSFSHLLSSFIVSVMTIALFTFVHIKIMSVLFYLTNSHLNSLIHMYMYKICVSSHTLDLSWNKKIQSTDTTNALTVINNNHLVTNVLITFTLIRWSRLLIEA